MLKVCKGRLKRQSGLDPPSPVRGFLDPPLPKNMRIDYQNRQVAPLSVYIDIYM